MSNKKNIQKITKEQLLNMERAARRNADIEMGFGTFRHKAHKMATDYNRQRNKRIDFNED